MMDCNGSGAVYWFSTIVCLVIGVGYDASSAHQSFIYGPDIFKTQLMCPKQFYSVVFDAGSTGTRVFVFQFKLAIEGNGIDYAVKLDKEYFLSTEPGISSFAHNVSEVSVTLKPLLQYAVKHVNQGYQPNTMLLFKATAGLRLLPSKVGEEILDEVRFLLRKSSFQIPDVKKIEIMGGGEEGLFGWVTANFLLGTLWNFSKENTVIALDLGGGSVQISFEIPPGGNFQSVCSHVAEVYKIHLLKSSFTVFTQSALGYGLKSAQLHIMGGHEEVHGKNDNASINNSLHLMSPCFISSFKSSWKHGRYNYTIIGKEPMMSRLKDCQSHVDKFVKSFNVFHSFEPQQQDIVLFSYFFDVAQWAGIIPKSERSMILTPSDFYQAATHHCLHKFSRERPFLCMSVLYIHSLLTKGVGLSDDTPLYIAKEIQGRQLSWTLGSALSILSDHFNYSSHCDTS